MNTKRPCNTAYRNPLPDSVWILFALLPMASSFALTQHEKFNSYAASLPQFYHSPTQLNAVSVLPPRGGAAGSSTNDNVGVSTKRRWPQKVIKRVFRRDQQQLQATAALLLDSNETPRGAASPIYFDYQEDVLSNALTPPMQSSSVSPLLVIEDSKAISSASSNEVKPTPLKPQGTIFTRTTRSVAESTLESLLTRWCNGNAKNMQVSCDPKSNIIDLARGRFRCDATVHCDAMKFPCLQFSGGRLSTQRLALNLYSFRLGRGHRFPNQFTFEANDVLFTADDLFASDCIRNGLARLLTRLLRNRGMKASKVHMESIQISKDSKLSCKGRVSTGLTADVPFEVRTGLSTASRGHVLTFPSLELSLSPALGLFIPIPEVSLDLGYSAQIHSLTLDPRTGLHISCQATVTPKHTLTLLQSYAQSTKSYAAPFSVDVGRWLTRLGNFSA